MQISHSRLFVACAVVVFATSMTLRAESDEEGIEYFEKYVRPVLAERCYSCHSSSAQKREGGLHLDTRAGWEAGGDNGPVIVPGDAASRLIQAIRYQDPELKMPPDKPLSDEAVARLEHWVRIGAPDPRDESVKSEPRHPSPADPIAGRQHWAFQPLVQPQLPELKQTEWPLTKVDSFVLAKLEEANLNPAADADPRTLVRRVYVQLTGLIPTPDQVAAFLNDNWADAYDRLVDELLQTPQFGERWGRHWLDLARYADSNGLDENFLFREAWRYRNWVLGAVNADMPFNQFVTHQIAGDLLPFESAEQRDRQRIAAGFLVIGPKVLLGNDEKNQRLEVADEQLDTIGRAILGQTLGCARCHDHKFDPIPTADYYSMAGILTSTEVMERRFMLNEQRVMERLTGLGADGEELDRAYEKYWRERPKTQEKRNKAQANLEELKKKEPTPLIYAQMAYQKAIIAELDHLLQKAPPIPPRAMIPRDRDQPGDESIRLAGQFDRLGDRVPRGFLRVLSDGSPQLSPGQSGRIELSRWLTDETGGAGQLSARVLANRVWHHLIGRGIVRTVDNFGRTGEAPSHPELLDYLASELIQSGWSVKDLVRTIVLSRTFRMSSRHDESGHSLDPDNRLHWRAHRRRLDPESLRDAMLLAAGQLDLKPMDSSVWYLGDQATAVGDNKVRRRTDFACRSVYLPVIRNDLPELFDVFDFADPHATTGMRRQTMVATQGLFILNDESVMAAAEATARHLLADKLGSDPAKLVDKMFEVILSARAQQADRDELLKFVHDMTQKMTASGDPNPELRAWSIACHALFASSRFQLLE